MPTFNHEPDGSISLSTRKAVVDHIHDLIEEWSVAKHPAKHRDHLGSSVIGDNCARKLYYSFHWVKLVEHKGRMRRLFNRGHKEENNFIDILSGIGFQFSSTQTRIKGSNEHFGGSSDGIAKMPWFDIPMLMEFKTHNTKSFTYLVEKGLLEGKPQHYSQMCSYGEDFKLQYGLYCAINKNDDDLFFDFVELDWNRGVELKNKASDIINAEFPPKKISDNPAYFDCKYCDFSGICHSQEPVEINCRSCKLSTPIENGEWFCKRYNQAIPKEWIAKGCEGHLSVNV